ncbi:Drmip-Hesp domain-containing protein [Blumeria hordei DH14]|uniref:Drmip-Hesp domain-containing protein n=1 Tax=Blumeria graminis f. sp. hordei (strain DH14) TaxID=546991 RepID=N1JEF7_BLUG1|nr:Drmip-Hesp domain-containing protein [Blumeria hordei DH14]
MRYYTTLGAAALAFVTTVTAQVPGFNAITSPTKDQQIVAGENFDVTWQHGGAPDDATVSIKLLQGKTPSTLDIGQMVASNIPSKSQKFTWKVPQDLGQHETYGFSMVLDGNEQIFQYSNPFHIIKGHGDKGKGNDGAEDVDGSKEIDNQDQQPSEVANDEDDDDDDDDDDSDDDDSDDDEDLDAENKPELQNDKVQGEVKADNKDNVQSEPIKKPVENIQAEQIIKPAEIDDNEIDGKFDEQAEKLEEQVEVKVEDESKKEDTSVEKLDGPNEDEDDDDDDDDDDDEDDEDDEDSASAPIVNLPGTKTSSKTPLNGYQFLNNTAGNPYVIKPSASAPPAAIITSTGVVAQPGSKTSAPKPYVEGGASGIVISGTTLFTCFALAFAMVF